MFNKPILGHPQGKTQRANRSSLLPKPEIVELSQDHDKITPDRPDYSNLVGEKPEERYDAQ